MKRVFAGRLFVIGTVAATLWLCAAVVAGDGAGDGAGSTAQAAGCGDGGGGGGGGGEGGESGGGGGGGGGGGADTASKSAVVHAAQDCGPPLQVDEPPVVEPVPETPPAVPPPADTPGNGTGTGSGAILGVTLPPPVLGKSFNLEPLFGSVYVSLPPGASAARAGARAAQTTGYVSPIPGRRFIPLSEARQVPMGSLLDMRTGIARLTTASTVAGLLYKGKFAAGVVQVLQSASVSQLGLTDMRMRGSTFKNCDVRAHGTTAVAARKKKRRIRGLRGNAKGRFRSSGRYSAATVRGTRWAVTDYCFGTLTRVKRGSVDVRDFRRGKTIRVREGKIYVARPAG